MAELECGHGQHVRHEPPWQLRPWVMTVEGRDEHLGTPLNCRLCEVGPGDKPVVDRREDAKLQGLCDDGADEVARD